MKIKKTFCLMAACLVMTTAVVNVSLAMAKHERAVSKLVQGNVQAKAYPIYDLSLWLVNLLFSENQIKNDIYYEYLEKETSCSDITLASGTSPYGSSVGRNLLTAFNIDLSVPRHVREGSLESNVSYRAELDLYDIYTFDYSIILKFQGDDWVIGFCKVVDKSAPNAVTSCHSYDECLDVANKRGTEYKQTIGLI